VFGRMQVTNLPLVSLRKCVIPYSPETTESTEKNIGENMEASGC
jgi:hypothetical protein